MRAVYIVIGLLLLGLGILGLIIPIIPGILFLVAAVYVLGKVSRRVRTWGEGNSVYRDVSRRFDRLHTVSAWDRARVLPLMLLEMTVTGLDRLATNVTRLVGRNAA